MSHIPVLDQTNRPYRFTKSNRRAQTETLLCTLYTIYWMFPSHAGECTTIGHLVQFGRARAGAGAAGFSNKPVHDSAGGMRITRVSSYMAQASHA